MTTSATLVAHLEPFEALHPISVELGARLEAGDPPIRYVDDIAQFRRAHRIAIDALTAAVDAVIADGLERGTVLDGLFILADHLSGWGELFSALDAAGWEPDAMTAGVVIRSSEMR